MTFDIPVWYEIFFLPTRRHRKERRKYSKSLYIVTIPELKESEFPAAFIVRKWQSVYKDARNYNDFDGNGDFRLFDEANREDCSKIPKARKAHKFSAFGKSLSIRTFAGHRHEPPYLLLYLKMKIIHEIGQAAFSYN